MLFLKLRFCFRVSAVMLHLFFIDCICSKKSAYGTMTDFQFDFVDLLTRARPSVKQLVAASSRKRAESGMKPRGVLLALNTYVATLEY